MPARLAIWGASGHALVVADIIRLRGEFEIAAFLDDVNPARHNSEFVGVPVVGGREQLAALAEQGVTHFIIAVGDCATRLRLAALVREQGFRLAVAVHPAAVVAAGVALGPGTVVAAGVVVNPGCQIGENVIINTSASVDHDGSIGDGAHIGPGAHLGGGVAVGRGAWIGIGATVSDHVQIGAQAVIGAGAVVVRDIPPGVVAYGVPAKPVRNVTGPND